MRWLPAFGYMSSGAANAGDKIRFIENVNAVLNYDNKKGSKRGRGKYRQVGQPERETVFVEKIITTEDGKGNVISRQTFREHATERQITQLKKEMATTDKKKRTKRKAPAARKRKGKGKSKRKSKK